MKNLRISCADGNKAAAGTSHFLSAGKNAPSAVFVERAFFPFNYGKSNMKKFLGLMMCLCALSFLTLGATGCKDAKKDTKKTDEKKAEEKKTDKKAEEKKTEEKKTDEKKAEEKKTEEKKAEEKKTEEKKAEEKKAEEKKTEEKKTEEKKKDEKKSSSLILPRARETVVATASVSRRHQLV